MKPNMTDAPYEVLRGLDNVTWAFGLSYAKLDAFMPLAQEQLVLSRLPAAERCAAAARALWRACTWQRSATFAVPCCERAARGSP